MNGTDRLMDGESTTIKVVPIGQKRGLMGSIVIAAVLAAGATGLYVYNQSDDSVSTSSPSVIASIKNTIEQSIAQENKFPIYGTFIKDEKLKKQIEEMGNFKLPDGMKPNQISRHIAQKMFGLGTYAGYTTSLISEREGFVSSLYNDVGWYAIGNGANLGVQNQSHIRNVFGTVSTDKSYIDSFVALSGKRVDGTIPPNYKNMSIAPQRSIQVAMVMSQTFEASVINSFSKHVKGSGKAKEVFESLKANEKAALVNIAYQKGSLSSNEAKSVVNYALDSNRTPEKALAAIDVVSITYMNNGTRISDTRSEILAKSMFSNLPVFEKVISNSVKPKDVTAYSSIFKGYTQSSSSGDIVLSDPIGDEKARSLANGQVWKGTIIQPVDISAMRKSRPVSTGMGMPGLL